MDNNLYALMNWPDIEELEYSECSQPKKLLGGHLCKNGFLIQVFRPDAVSVSVTVEGKKRAYPMEKVDETGFFAVLIPSKKKLSYTVNMETVKGEKLIFSDPYAFDNITSKKDYKAFHAGVEKNAEKILGNRVMEVNHIKGTLFTVWAPNAVRVSIVGEFNRWDGRVYQMEKVDEDGIFELFVPGIKEGDEYLYEVKSRGSKIGLKLDPYSREASVAANYYSVVSQNKKYQWEDSAWMKRRAADADKSKPLSVLEINLMAWADIVGGQADYSKLGQTIIDYVKKTGYTHVEFMPVAEFFGEKAYGYASADYFAPASRYGSPDQFKACINAFHKAGIGVIIDWNAAYFGCDSRGLYDFDGGSAYGWLRPRLEKRPGWAVTTFAYEKGEVRSFLLSNVRMWMDEYHVDGVRIDGVASMLYLDYGKAPSEWQPNMYGGNENLEASAFIREMNKFVHGRKDGVITIAEETSGWNDVTDVNGYDSLGFDYKWDNGFKDEFLSFVDRDPLFRKDVYGRLTYSMLYHYRERFILSFSHDEFSGQKRSMYDIAAGSTDQEKLADIRAAYGYIYAHPGAKLLTMGQDIGLDTIWTTQIKEAWNDTKNDVYHQMMTYLYDLNALYKEHKPMYEQDDHPDGFEWIENANAEETVIGLVRRDQSGEELTVVLNFTPVERKDYRLAVLKSGKYREIFNSDSIKYGGNSKPDAKEIFSECTKTESGRDILRVTLPPSSMVVYSYTPYSEIELKEIEIKAEAAKAKKAAEDKAEIARNMAREADIRAKEAIEAERVAKEACENAVRARKEAEERAKAAMQESKKIDEDTRKKLEALRKR